MALINCPECNREISDKAVSCPHCGMPIAVEDNKKKSRGRGKKNKRRKLPNGFGSITEIRGKNLRKPFYARKTVGNDLMGKPILKPLKPEAYFETYNEAYAALVDFNRNPYDLEPDMLMSELYEKWTDAHFPTLKSQSSVRTISASWAYCSTIYTMRARDVRARHIKGCMEEGFVIGKVGQKKGEIINTTPGVKARIKSMFNTMFDYALEYEIVDKNYSRTFELSKEVMQEQELSKQHHIPFTEEEMKKMWENINNIKFIDMILIQAYSGWRPGEMVELEMKNVHLDEWYFQGGMKTASGKNRVVPIHSKIRELVKKYYDHALSIGSNKLFNDTSSLKTPQLTYDKYSNRFKKAVRALGLNPEHRAHDPRMTFVTMAKKAKVDEYVIKILAGHHIEDITEKVYTVRNLEWLREEIEKIK